VSFYLGNSLETKIGWQNGKHELPCL